MRFKLIGFALMCSAALNAQTLSRIEYFIDTDSGFGQGTSVQLPSDTSGIVNFTADLTDITNGVHRLYVRALDDSGRWGAALVYPFLKLAVAASEAPPALTRIEYFIDNDLGIGSGVSVPVTNDSFQVVVNLDTVSVGVHRLYVRAQDARGSWSTVNVVPFVREGDLNPQRAPITSVEYFFSKNGVRTDTMTRVVSLSPPSFDTNFVFNAILGGLLADSTYQISVFARDARNLVSQSIQHTFLVSGNISTKREDKAQPQSYSLSQNYPNPFNPETVIEYELPKTTAVKVELFDMIGRKLITLVNEVQRAGKYRVSLNTSPYALATGIYFYRLSAGAFSATKKMMLLK